MARRAPAVAGLVEQWPTGERAVDGAACALVTLRRKDSGPPGARSAQGQGGAAGGNVLVLGDGRRVGMAVFGAGEGFPVIALHGMPGSRLMYATMVQAAARRGVRLIAVDRPGYGRSDRRAGGNPAGLCR